uniref:Cathepsin B2 n=1 Tax=Dysdercus peruvianus TaxID=685034 RepID=A0A7U3NI91_9HEMI|nr:cathepsin B2 [Dysdercus peruvianus]
MKRYLAICILLGAANVALTDYKTLQSIAEEVNSLQTTWKARTDFPTNTTAASYKMLLGARESLHKPVYSLMTPVDAVSNIPEEFDARKHWPNCPISHIRDQGHCGSCWAVSSASVFSDRLCIASKGQFVMPLSEEELLTCCADCGDGCDGGSTISAWNYFEYHGIVTGGDYKSLIGCQPYSLSSEHKSLVGFASLGHLTNRRTPVCVKQCTNPLYDNPFEYDHHKVSNAYYVPSTESAIQQEILAHGPVVGFF